MLLLLFGGIQSLSASRVVEIRADLGFLQITVGLVFLGYLSHFRSLWLDEETRNVQQGLGVSLRQLNVDDSLEVLLAEAFLSFFGLLCSLLLGFLVLRGLDITAGHLRVDRHGLFLLLLLVLRLVGAGSSISHVWLVLIPRSLRVQLLTGSGLRAIWNRLPVRALYFLFGLVTSLNHEAEEDKNSNDLRFGLNKDLHSIVHNIVYVGNSMSASVSGVTSSPLMGSASVPSSGAGLASESALGLLAIDVASENRVIM